MPSPEYIFSQRNQPLMQVRLDDNRQRRFYGLSQYAVYPAIGSNLAYPVLGLIDELSELYEKLLHASRSNTVVDWMSITMEAADVVWYINQVAFEVGHIIGRPGWLVAVLAETADNAEGEPPASFWDDEVLELIADVAGIAGIAKKTLRDGKGSLTEHKVRHIGETLIGVAYSMFNLAHSAVGFSPDQLIEELHGKLSGRQERGTLHGDGDVR
jgi:hypothetical protein